MRKPQPTTKEDNAPIPTTKEENAPKDTADKVIAVVFPEDQTTPEDDR